MGRRQFALFTAAMLWLSGIAYGAQLWMAHAHNPGAIAPLARQWPTASQLAPDQQHGTLVFFAHPHCPCTRAGFAKLDEALAALPLKPAIYVVLSSDGSPTEVQQSANRRRAEAIEGVQAHIDHQGIEAGRFGAATSGFVLYYDAAGRLRFAGGLTAERGGEEPSEYESSLVQAIRNPEFPLVSTPVFGCGL